MGWGDFMETLSQRLVEEQRVAVERDCERIAADSGIESTEISDVCVRLTQLGIVGLGKLRAAWMLNFDSYLKHEDGNPLSLISNLVLGIGMVEKLSGRRAQFRDDGVVEFYRDDRVMHVLVCSGGGSMTLAKISNGNLEATQSLARSGHVIFGCIIRRRGARL